MPAAISTICILAFTALLTLGCKKKNPDPYHIDLRDFKSPSSYPTLCTIWLA